jgi:hypothetical protein
MPRKLEQEFWNPHNEVIACSKVLIDRGMLKADDTAAIFDECGMDIRVSRYKHKCEQFLKRA